MFRFPFFPPLGWLILTLPFVAFGVGTKDEPLIVLPVGDSITQGGKRDREEYTYRYPLQQLLHGLGIRYEFVGTRQAGLHADAEWPEVAPGVPFDPDHAGYYGAKTRAVVNRVMKNWDEIEKTPHVALIHLGTNDQGSENHVEAVQKPLREFIRFLRTKNPEICILLGHLNFRESEGALAIRPLVEELAEEMDTPESRVVTVHHYEGFVSNPKAEDTDTFDWAHPNPSGQRKMAERWLGTVTELR
ncbi:MAG: SGNH/GDSL hydrolase family protein [Opitutales bacterium]